MDEPIVPGDDQDAVEQLKELFGEEPPESYITNENHRSALEIANFYKLPVVPCQGKRPKGIKDWSREASANPDRITQLFREYPNNPSVGIVTGNGICAIDIDKRNGGFETLAEFESNNRPLPETLMIATGGGGKDYIYRMAPDFKGDIPTATAVFGSGTDVRGDRNGLIIAPHSVHPDTGEKYTWINWGTPIATMPDWLAKAILNADKKHKNALRLFKSKVVKIGKKMHKSELTPLLIRMAGGVKQIYGYDGDALVREMMRFCKCVAEDPDYYDEPYVRDKCRYALEEVVYEPKDGYVALRENEDGSLVQVTGGVEVEQAVVVVTDRQTHVIGKELMAALAVYNNPPFVFIQDDQLVEFHAKYGKTKRVTYKGLADMLDNSATILKIKPNGVAVPTKLDVWVAEALMSRGQALHVLPELRQVIKTPMMLADGRIIDTEGYDADSGYYLALEKGFEIYARPEPSREAAQKAYSYLVEEVFRDFPFEDPASLVNAMGYVIGSAAKGIIDDIVPMCLLIARKRDTGKTLLSKAILALATGTSIAVRHLPHREEELEKALVSNFRKKPAGTIFDNVVASAGVKLNMAILNAILTSRVFQGRILGRSEDVEMDMRGHIIIMNGNNLNVGAELGRRSVPVMLNAHTADPAKREPEGGYKYRGEEKLIGWCLSHKSEVNAMLLTILESWWTEYERTGVMPGDGETPILDSFESWSRIVGSILTFCGVGDLFMNNRDEVMSDLSTEADEDYAFMRGIHEVFGEKPWRAKELAAKLVLESGPLFELIPDELAAYLTGGSYKTPQRAVGKYLQNKRESRFGEAGLLLTSLTDEQLSKKRAKKADLEPRKDRDGVLTYRVLEGR